MKRALVIVDILDPPKHRYRDQCLTNTIRRREYYDTIKSALRYAVQEKIPVIWTHYPYGICWGETEEDWQKVKKMNLEDFLKEKTGLGGIEEANRRKVRSLNSEFPIPVGEMLYATKEIVEHDGTSYYSEQGAEQLVKETESFIIVGSALSTYNNTDPSGACVIHVLEHLVRNNQSTPTFEFILPGIGYYVSDFNTILIEEQLREELENSEKESVIKLADTTQIKTHENTREFIETAEAEA